MLRVHVTKYYSHCVHWGRREDWCNVVKSQQFKKTFVFSQKQTSMYCSGSIFRPTRRRIPQCFEAHYTCRVTTNASTFSGAWCCSASSLCATASRSFQGMNHFYQLDSSTHPSHLLLSCCSFSAGDQVSNSMATIVCSLGWVLLQNVTNSDAICSICDKVLPAPFITDILRNPQTFEAALAC